MGWLWVVEWIGYGRWNGLVMGGGMDRLWVVEWIAVILPFLTNRPKVFMCHRKLTLSTAVRC